MTEQLLYSCRHCKEVHSIEVNKELKQEEIVFGKCPQIGKWTRIKVSPYKVSKEKTMREDSVLRRLRKGLTQTQIADSMGVSRQCVGQFIKSLVDKGFLVKQGRGRYVERVRLEDEKGVVSMIRRIDQLGRIVIPKEMRNQLGANWNGAPFYISFDGNRIILEKVEETCRICGTDKGLIGNMAQEAYICRSCLDDFGKNGHPKGVGLLMEASR